MNTRTRFFLSTVLGLGFFLVPLPVEGRWTVLFDVAVRAITRNAPWGVGVYCLLLIVGGGVITLTAAWKRRDDTSTTGWLYSFKASWPFTALRLAGIPLAVMMFAHLGPGWLTAKNVSGLMWHTLVFSVGVIIPIGAAALAVLVSYGCLEFVGTLMRPVMRPLFRLPGRSALDDLTSWIGSYSVGLYLTRKLTTAGRYNRREAFTIATCFSTVSIGFVGVVAGTLGLLSIFPVVFVTYFVVVHLTAVIMVRLWPTTSIPDTYLAQADPETDEKMTAKQRFTRAWAEARRRAGSAQGFGRTVVSGFLDGLVLAATLLGTILAVGTCALLVAEYTDVFSVLGRPLQPVLDLLGLPDSALLAPASIAGITEMYIPALLSRNAAVEGRFFICVLSISQLIFFSSVGPMMMDMFRDIPIRIHHLAAIFLIRTAILIPVLAAATHLLSAAGAFQGLQ